MTSLGGAFGEAVTAAVGSVLAVGAAVGVGAVTYTPAGGTAQSAHAAIRIHEEPQGGAQERSSTITLFQLEVATEPTDGATVRDLATDETWTIRRAVRLAATWSCEAWA